MTCFSLGDLTPKLPKPGDFWIAPNASLIGDVELHEQASVWFGAVLRADDEKITIGAKTNIQDGAVLHVDPGFPVMIAAGCTIGHKAMIHGCSIGENSLVGMSATILNGAKIGRNCLIAAGALIKEGTVIADNSLVVGMPGRVIRTLDAAAVSNLRKSAESYVQRAIRYRAELQ